MSDDLVLVIGGTGKTGRRVAVGLVGQGVPVRVGARSGTPAFDWQDRATWDDALEGVTAIYLTYYPDLAAAGAAEDVEAFAKLAVAKGATRIVLMSGRNEPEAQRAEALVHATGAELTVLRCSWFAQNFSESLFTDGIIAGELALPVGEVPEPFIDIDDIADAGIAALTQPGHAGKVYELTGPKALSFAEAVSIIADATGRDIRFVSLAPDAFVVQARAAEMPEEIIEVLVDLFAETLDGRNSPVTDGVERALGRPARDFADFARRTAATGVWDSPSTGA